MLLSNSKYAAISIFNFSQVVRIALLLFILLFVMTNTSQAQTSGKRVKLIHTDELMYDKSMVDAQRLIGHVQLEYEGTMFYSDSAYLYKNDDFDAFGNIRLIKGVDYNLTGDELHFDHAKKNAQFRNNVTLRDRQMTLTTNFLNYNTATEIADYTGGGNIVSTKDRNTLSSQKGTYHSKTETFFFKDKVVLKNPDYTVTSDTLKYLNTSEIAYFFGPTNIKGDKTSLYCENGFYDTKKDESRFGKNARVNSEKNILKGDSIYYNGVKGTGEVFRNVSIRDTTSNYIITGDYGFHDEKSKESFVTKRALLTQFYEGGDSLFVHADTLRSRPDSLQKNRVFAYHGVKLFKTDMQGLCDSLVYVESDSLISLYKNPVLWNEDSQITGDTIDVRAFEGKIENFYVSGNSWIISEASKDTYNQIKGRIMTGYFTENDLTTVDVNGNGQLVYFPEEEKKGKKNLMGHNKGDCSNIRIHIADKKIIGIKMEIEPNSKFAPLSLSTLSEYKLEGFNWRGEERPKSRAELLELN